MRLRRAKTQRKLACREVLSFSDIGRLARIEDLAAYAAVSSVSCDYSAMRLRRAKTQRKLACREVLSFSDIGRLARIEDLAAYAAVSSVSCANPRCMAE